MRMLLMILCSIEVYAGYVRVGKRNISKLAKNKVKKLVLYIFSLKALEEL